MISASETKGCRADSVVREAMADYGRVARYAAGERVFAEGEPSEKLCLLVKGEVSIEISVPGAGAVPIATLGPDEIFGWSSVLTPRLQDSTARAVSETEILWLSGEKLRDLAAEDSHFGFDLYRCVSELIARRLYATRAELVELLAVAPV